MDIKNNPKDKRYWNRIDFSEGGLNIKKFCRKLDLMNAEMIEVRASYGT